MRASTRGSTNLAPGIAPDCSRLAIAYMPDFGSAQSGVLKMIICSASGNTVIDIGSDGRPIKHDQHHKSDHPCAFSGLAHLTLPGLIPAVLPPVPAYVTGHALLQQARIPPTISARNSKPNINRAAAPGADFSAQR